MIVGLSGGVDSSVSAYLLLQQGYKVEGLFMKNWEEDDGEEIGTHQGLMYHTLGQRKGLGIGGTKEGSEDPWYVVDKDVENNILIVAQGHDHPRLMSVGLIAQQLHWVNREPLQGTLRCTVKTRYRQTDISCEVIPLNDDNIEVHFDQPQIAVTPGQSAVFYQDEVCLGGGVIESAIK